MGCRKCLRLWHRCSMATRRWGVCIRDLFRNRGAISFRLRRRLMRFLLRTNALGRRIRGTLLVDIVDARTIFLCLRFDDYDGYTHFSSRIWTLVLALGLRKSTIRIWSPRLRSPRLCGSVLSPIPVCNYSAVYCLLSSFLSLLVRCGLCHILPIIWRFIMARIVFKGSWSKLSGWGHWVRAVSLDLGFSTHICFGD